MQSTNTDVKLEVADELVFSKISVENAIDSRKLVRVRPTASGQTYNPTNNIIYMTLPNEYISSPSKFLLEFKASCSATGSTYARFPRYVWNLINQIRFLKDSTEVIPPLRKYGMAKTFRYAFSSNVDSSISTGILCGDGDQTQRNTWGASSRTYMIPITELFVENTPVLPLKDLGNKSEWILEITLEPGTVIETDGTDPTFSITSPVFYMETLKPSLHYRNMVRARIASGKFRLQCMPYKYNSSTLISGSSTYTVSLPINVESLRHVIAFMRTASTINTTTTNDRDSTYNYNNVNNYQLRINHDLHPQEVVTCSGTGVEAYMEVQRVFDQDDTLFAQSHGLINLNNFLNDEFVMALDLRRSRPFGEKGKFHISGHNVVGEPVQLDIKLASDLSVNQQLEQLYYYDSVLKVDPQGNFLRIE